MKNILVVGKSRKARIFKSARAVSRQLSGTYDQEGTHSTVSRRCNEGGGYVKNVWVEYSNLPSTL